MTQDTGHLATHSTSFLAGLTLLWNALAEHAPPWALVPPLALSLASLVGAAVSARKVAQEMRHDRELHEARLKRARYAYPDDAGGLEYRP